jgi:hypothetical protein
MKVTGKQPMMNRWIICFGVVLLSSVALAQQQPANLDPDLLAVKLDGCSNLLDSREKQLVNAAHQIAVERTYWAAYVAGLKPDPNAPPPQQQASPHSEKPQ